MIATDQELVIMLKWTLRTKFKAMHQPKSVDVAPCLFDQCTSSRRKR